MATNKRKDAAALFELIDKSSLKVPKNAGSLKIPSWWSSKTNTAAASASAPASAAPEAKEAPAGGAAGGSKLFDTAANGVAPTIRAPGPGGGGASAAARLAAVPTPAVPVTAKPAISSAEMGRKLFSPGTPPETVGRGAGFTLSRVPPWALVTGAAFIVLLICLVAFSLMHKGGNTPAAAPGSVAQNTGPQNIPGLDGQQQQPLLPPMSPTGPVLVTGSTDNGGGGTAGNPDETPHQGRVYEPGTLQRSFDQYYIIVAHSPTESIARRNAKFLADNGVDVAIEITQSKGKTWYLITSAKGYPSMVAAEPDRKKIVAIGHLTQDYKLHHKAWDDAYVNQLNPPAAAAAK